MNEISFSKSKIKSLASNKVSEIIEIKVQLFTTTTITTNSDLMEREIESILDLHHYHGIKAKQNRTKIMWILFIYFWIDYSWSIYVVTNMIDPNDCMFINVACLALPEAPLSMNLAWLNYRTILFTLYNYWFFDKQQWLKSVDDLYLKLKVNNLQIETDKIRKKFFPIYRISIFLTASYSIIYSIMAKKRSLLEFFISNIHVLTPTYFLGFFFIQNYLLNTICIELLQTFKLKSIECFRSQRNDYDLFKTFYNLYLLIFEARKYFYVFYTLSSIFLFASCLCLYYCLICSNLIGYNYFGIGFVMITFLFFAIYISWFTGKIDHESKSISETIYKIINFEIYEQNSSAFEKKFIIEVIDEL